MRLVSCILKFSVNGMQHTVVLCLLQAGLTAESIPIKEKPYDIISDLACTRLANPHYGSACLPSTLYLHPGPPFIIKVRRDEIFLGCTIVLFHPPSKYFLSNSTNLTENK